MKHSHVECLLPIFVAALCISLCWGEHDEDTWMEPDAWTRDDHLLSFSNNEDKCLCFEKSQSSEEAVALVYFKKFISHLFNRKSLVYDPTYDTYERILSLSVQGSQLSKLEKLQDPRDLDNILTEIFSNARTESYKFNQGQQDVSGVKGLIADIFLDMWKLFQTSEVRFLMIAMLAIICGWFLHKRYKIGYAALIGGSLFLFGYLHTYLECNREMEVNQMLEVLRHNEESVKNKPKTGILSFLWNIFSTSNSQDVDKMQMIKKSAKISLGFCRPDHVLIIYFNDIFLKYMELLLEQCTTTLTSLQGRLSFPYNIFAGLFLICIIGYMLKLTFKYVLSPRAWSNLIHRDRHEQLPALSQPNTNSHVGDRLSGENLKILLHALKTVSNSKEQMNAVSGVEEVREAIEPVSQQNQVNIFEKTVKNTLDKAQDNNNSSKVEVEDNIPDVKMEDVPDDT